MNFHLITYSGAQVLLVQWMDMPGSPIGPFDFVEIFAGCQAATKAMYLEVCTSLYITKNYRVHTSSVSSMRCSGGFI